MNKDLNNHLKPPKIKISNDPFTRLIIKDNRSPNLKPVCLKSSRKVNSCRSQDKLKDIYFLPPISPQPRNIKFFDLREVDRTSLRTPNFASREKCKKTLGNQTQIEESFYWKDSDKNSDAN